MRVDLSLNQPDPSRGVRGDERTGRSSRNADGAATPRGTDPRPSTTAGTVPPTGDTASGRNGAAQNADGADHGGDAAAGEHGGNGARVGPAPLDVALRGWAAMVDAAYDACLVLDRSALVVACSAGALTLLGMPGRDGTIGRGLLDGILYPVDFTAVGHRLADWEVAKLPPLAALTTGGLSRSLIRIRYGHGIRTVDAVATPLRDASELIGSLTFFREI